MKTDKNIAKICDWMQLHEKTLKNLYKEFLRDTKDKTTTFVIFSASMYEQCKH